MSDACVAHAYILGIQIGMEAADKLVVTIHTFERWKVDKDLAMNTTMCLTYDKMTTNHECVDVPKCLWCIRFTVYF